MSGETAGVFLITSSQSFLSEARRAAAGRPGLRISGKADMANGATAPAGLEALRSGTASVVLMDLDSGPSEAMTVLQELCASAPEGRILVASSNRDPDLILQAMRAGAADFLSVPIDPAALAAALERSRKRAISTAPEAASRSRIMAFMNAKGGCGATTVAVNLGVALCALDGNRSRSVVLVDLDSPGGDAAAMLKLEPAYSLADVAANIHRLDMDLLNSMTVRHESGLVCLAAGGAYQAYPAVGAKQMGALIDFLARHFDEVILAGGGLTEEGMAAVNQAHVVHMVTTNDFLALRRAQSMIRGLREFGVPGEALGVVVNRIQRGADLTLADAKQALDAPIVWSIPDDPRTAERAVNEGVPVVSHGRGRLQAAFSEYADTLAGEDRSSGTGSGLSGIFRKLVPGRAGATG